MTYSVTCYKKKKKKELSTNSVHQRNVNTEFILLSCKSACLTNAVFPQVPSINELEQRMQNLLRSRATRLLQRRQQDVRDQCQDYMTSRYLAPWSNPFSESGQASIGLDRFQAPCSCWLRGPGHGCVACVKLVIILRCS